MLRGATVRLWLWPCHNMLSRECECRRGGRIREWRRLLLLHIMHGGRELKLRKKLSQPIGGVAEPSIMPQTCHGADGQAWLPRVQLPRMGIEHGREAEGVVLTHGGANQLERELAEISSASRRNA